MKFLVTTEDGPILPPGKDSREVIKKVALPAFDQLIALESAGKIVGGLPVGGRAFAFIMEAESSDEVDRVLHGLTNWGVMDWQVTPLQSFVARAELERAAVKK